MNPLLAYPIAARWPNLLIIALTQVFMRYLVLEPFVKAHDLALAFSDLDFALLVLSTVLIAAAGNIINDYFDLKIDRINKPEKIIVGRYIKRRIAMVVHIVLNIIGFALGVYVALQVGIWQLCFIQLFWMITLWYYSTELKYTFLWGNVAIAICVGLVPLSVGLHEIPMIIDANQGEHMEVPEILEYFQIFIYRLFYWVTGFALFAFLATMLREIIKDMADIKGDRAYKCRTIPIVLGIKTTKNIVLALGVLIGVLLVLLQQFYLADLYTLFYFLFLVIPLLLATIVMTYRSSDRVGFSRASSFGKYFLLAGLCYSFVVYYLLTYGG